MRLRLVVMRLLMTAEDTVQLVVLIVPRIQGRHLPMIVPFIGHGTTRRIRVGGRVVRGRPEAEVPAVAPLPPTPRSRRAVLRSTIARFLTVELPGRAVTVDLPVAVYIRRTPMASARRIVEVDALAAAVTASGVPMPAVDDSVEIAARAVGLGLLDPGAESLVATG